MALRGLGGAYRRAHVDPASLRPGDATVAGLDVVASSAALDRAWRMDGLWYGLARVFWRASVGYLCIGACLVIVTPLAPMLIERLIGNPTTRNATLLTAVLIAAAVVRFIGTVAVRNLVYRIDLTVQQVIFRRLLRAGDGWLGRRNKAPTTVLLEYAQMTSQIAFVPELVVQCTLALVLMVVLIVSFGWVGFAVCVVVGIGVGVLTRLAARTSDLAKDFLDTEQLRSSMIEVLATKWQTVGRARLGAAALMQIQSIRARQQLLLQTWSRSSALNTMADRGLTGFAVWLAASLALALGSDLDAGSAVGLLVLVRMLMNAVASSLATYRTVSFTHRIGLDLKDLIRETNREAEPSVANTIPHGSRVLVVGEDDAEIDAWLRTTLSLEDESTDCWVGRSQPAFDGSVAQNVVLWSRPVHMPSYHTAVEISGLVGGDRSDDWTDERRISGEHESLSDGELVRLSLARALYCNPRTLVLDDVFAPLDPATAEEICGQLLGARDRPTTFIRTTRPEPVRWVDHVAVVQGSHVKYLRRDQFAAAELSNLLGDLSGELSDDEPDPVQQGSPNDRCRYVFHDEFDPPGCDSFDAVRGDGLASGLRRVLAAAWPRWAVITIIALLGIGSLAELLIASLVEAATRSLPALAALGAVVLLGGGAVYGGRLLSLSTCRPRVDGIHERLVTALIHGRFAGRHHILPTRLGRDFYAFEIRVPTAVTAYVAGCLAISVALLLVLSAGPAAIPPLVLLSVLGAIQLKRGQTALVAATQLSAAARVPLLNFGSRCVGDTGFHQSSPQRQALIERFTELGAIRGAAIARWSQVQLRTLLGVEVLSLGVLAVAVWSATLGGPRLGIASGVVIYAAYMFSQQVGALIDQTQMMNGVLQGGTRVLDLAAEGDAATHGGDAVDVSGPLDLAARSSNDAPVLAVAKAVAAKHEHGVANPVDLRLFPGDWQVVVGASGVGKSTLLRCLSGAAPLMTGKIFLCPPRSRIAIAESDLPALPVPVGDLFDDAGHTILQSLLAATQRGAIPHDRLLAELSHPERQLVGLARAVATDPALLLLDESTSALQAAHEVAVLDSVRMMLPEAAALVVLHRRANRDHVGTVAPLVLESRRKLSSERHVLDAPTPSG